MKVFEAAKLAVYGLTILSTIVQSQILNTLEYPRFYQIRYGRDMGKPLPMGKVEFLIVENDADTEHNLPRYVYLMLTQTLDNIKVSRDINRFDYRYVTTLDQSEIEGLFEKYGEDAFGRKKYLLRLSILQKADIEKIYQQMSSVDPNLPKLSEINYGIKLNTKMEPVTDFKGNCISDSNVDYYSTGHTIVLPECYITQKNQCFFYNFNNPAVREYCVRVMLKTRMLYGSHVFLDNYGVFGCFEESIEAGRLGKGGKKESLRQYAEHLSAVCKDAKKRGGADIQIIANCFLPRKTAEERIFLETLTNANNIAGFDGFMAEGIYHRYGFNEDLVSWFVDWADYLNKRNVMLLLAPSTSNLAGGQDSKYARNLHLFTLLIARSNVYVWYSNTTDQPIIDYDAHRIQIGSPQTDKPDFSESRWRRQYGLGTVVLDVKKKGWDAIWLEN